MCRDPVTGSVKRKYIGKFKWGKRIKYQRNGPHSITPYTKDNVFMVTFSAVLSTTHLGVGCFSTLNIQ